jgi:hypothetical protein
LHLKIGLSSPRWLPPNGHPPPCPGGVEPAGICWYQFVVDFFLLRKSDSKQFALCEGTSERIDGGRDYSGENDGLARRPEDAINNEGGQETYRWLVPSTGSAFGNI